jgi:hypothetical protein
MDRKSYWLLPLLITTALFLVPGCTTLQSRSTATAALNGMNYDQAFRLAIQSAMDAGLTIGSADKDAGLITATRGANSLLTFENPAINITVLDGESISTISVASTVGGQMIDYGTTADTVEPGFARWRGSTGSEALETLAKPRIPSFTRRVRMSRPPDSP